MSLSGNLGFVSLDEVLRLITRSKQTGAVEVTGDRMSGRIYVGRSGISLATTFTNDTLRSHLTRSGLLTADQVRDLAAGSFDLGSAAEEARITALLREMSVEGLYQMGMLGTTFEVVQDETTPFGSPSGFDLEDLLADSRKRLSEWEEVKAIVSDLDRELRLQRELGDRTEVTIDKDSWRVVSQIGHGASIRDLSEQIGTTEFWTARVAAGLVEGDLMSMENPVRDDYDEASADAGHEPPEEARAFEEENPEPEAIYTDATAEIDEPIEVDDAVEADQDVETESVFAGSPEVVEDVEVDEVAEVESDEVPFAAADAFAEVGLSDDQESVVSDDEDSADLSAESVDPDESWWKEPEAEDNDEAAEAVFAEASTMVATEVEEDTESFLEKVFSELEPTTEPEEGYGLLRRRRMGAIRDNSPSN